MADSTSHLKSIIQEITSLNKNDEKCLVVFDLDSTLFDVSPRIQKILHDFSSVDIHQQLYPDSCKILGSIQIKPQDWGFKDALVRAGLDGHHLKFQQELRDYWHKHFFSNEYLVHDLPYPGAVEYVDAIYRSGAKIVYLTGRDAPRMGAGSEFVLNKWNFPMHPLNAKLVLKPNQKMDDAQFKCDYLNLDEQQDFAKIWFFENEPVNINLVRRVHPQIEIVFFDSTHSGKTPPPQDLPTIFHYLLD